MGPHSMHKYVQFTIESMNFLSNLTTVLNLTGTEEVGTKKTLSFRVSLVNIIFIEAKLISLFWGTSQTKTVWGTPHSRRQNLLDRIAKFSRETCLFKINISNRSTSFRKRIRIVRCNDSYWRVINWSTIVTIPQNPNKGKISFDFCKVLNFEFHKNLSPQYVAIKKSPALFAVKVKVLILPIYEYERRRTFMNLLEILKFEKKRVTHQKHPDNLTIADLRELNKNTFYTRNHAKRKSTEFEENLENYMFKILEKSEKFEIRKKNMFSTKSILTI